jgi:hypothetical protein
MSIDLCRVARHCRSLQRRALSRTKLEMEGQDMNSKLELVLIMAACCLIKLNQLAEMSS